MVALFSVENFYLLLLLFVPLSVQLRFILPEPPADLFLPTEPMLLVLLFLFLFRAVNSREVSARLFTQPFSILIIIMLVWMAITSITSVSPLISIKAFISRVWFISGFYLFSQLLFKGRDKMVRSFKFLTLGIIPVLVYNFIRLAQVGFFNQKAAHSTMWPFFNDHTSFGAAIAFIIPVVIYIIVSEHRLYRRLFWVIIVAILFTGLLFSYSRAAWLSLAVASILAVVLLLRVPWKIIASGVITIITVVIISWGSIINFLESIRQDSSADISDHIKSAANITTDASNMERINRWKAAYRMVREKPLLGWGPNTYQFNYAPYQMQAERTIISTNFGDRGNAHSEYFGSAVDSGIPGALLYLSLVIYALFTGIRYTFIQDNRMLRLFMIAVVTGLATYAIHGMLNNFLDTDKLSAPFWISIAVIASMNEELKGREID
jgi:O-antigen ligase